MFRTTQQIEEQLPELAKILGYEKQPKWMTLRFAINISLSLPKKLDEAKKLNY